MKKLILLIFSFNFFCLIHAKIAYPILHANNNTSLSEMLNQVIPSVVSINIEGNGNDKNENSLQQFFGHNSPFCQENSPFHNSPICQEENDNDKNKDQKFSSIGSGVIIDAIKGYVITNYHVIENATKIQVQTYDGKIYLAKIIGIDELSDIALIKIKNFEKLTEMKISDSDDLRVGDYALAIGNPYGLGETVTSGIISALGRSGLNPENYESFIQTDAAINKGNSGGALTNLIGELIGINTSILALDGGNIGIGFAIPSNMVKNFVYQIKDYGSVKRLDLGILCTDSNEILLNSVGIYQYKEEDQGIFISKIIPNSMASKIGLKPGDIILSINGKDIFNIEELRTYIGTEYFKESMKFNIIRNKIKTEIVFKFNKNK